MRLHNVGNDGWNQVVAEDSCDLGLESVDTDMLIGKTESSAEGITDHTNTSPEARSPEE